MGMWMRPITTSDAKVVIQLQERLKLFEIIDDGMVRIPDQVRLLLGPIRVTCRSHPVIWMIECATILPVGAKDFGNTAVRPSLRPFRKFQRCLLRRVPEG